MCREVFFVGAVKAKVREPLGAARDLVLIAEFEAWPEPKVLDSAQLRGLIARYGGSYGAAKVIGASEAFVRQNGKETRVHGNAQTKNGRSLGQGRPKKRPV